MSRNSRLLALAALMVPAGCADYMNHHDTMTLAAGDFNQTNRMLQTEDPFNEQSFDTHIHTDGGRAARIIRKYQQLPPKGESSKAGVAETASTPATN
jgi:hypothetical protein